VTHDASTSRPTRVLDVHAHIAPSGLLAADGGWREGVRLRVGERLTPPVPRPLADVPARLALMAEAGVDAQVVSPWVELQPAGLAPADAAAHVRAVNDALAADVAGAAGRLVGMGIVPQHDGDAAAAELDRAVADLGMCGVLVATSGVGRGVADPALDPLWAAAQRRRALVMVHPYAPVAADRTRAEGTGDLVGTPLEGTVAVAGMLRAGVLDRFPGLRVCVVHGGGALPALAGRLDALWHLGADEAPGGGRPPSSRLRDLYYDTLTHDDRALRWLAELAGADRLLLGSDFPFPTGDARPVGRVERLAAGRPQEGHAVLGGTLEALLRDVDHA
jgi:aminocarboxymuconate-semialdehyde decarboxylase